MMLGLVACQKKEPATAEVGETVVESLQAQENPEEVVKVPVLGEDALGFATRLPKEVELYVALHHPGDLFNALMSFDPAGLWIQYEDESMTKEEKQKEVDKIMQEMNEMLVDNAFFCVESGLASNVELAGDVYQDMNATQMKLGVKVLAHLLKMENPALFAEELQMQEWLGEWMNGMDTVARVVESGGEAVQIPSIYMGFEPPDERMQEWYEHFVEGLEAAEVDGNGVKPLSFEKYGTEFHGVELNLSQWLNAAAEDVDQENLGEDLDEALGEELGEDVGKAVEDLVGTPFEGMDFSKVIEEWTKKWESMSLIFVVGKVDDHLVFFMGENAEALHLVDQVDGSLASNEEFSVLGGGRLLGALYASDELIRSVQTWRGSEKIFKALGKAFQEETLPNSEVLVEQCSALAAMEKRRVRLPVDDYLLMCFRDQGLRFESVGGTRNDELDYSKPLRMVPVADGLEGSLFFRCHWMGNQKRQALEMDYAEALVGLLAGMIDGGCLAFLERSEESSGWYESSKKIYDEVVAPEVVRFWGAYRKLSLQALDGEVAMLMDFNGGMPRVPGLPAQVIAQGKVPRVMLARPVKDRAALNSAYDDVETTVENVLDYVSILSETELPMPDFLSASKGDLTTWFYPFPTLSDDFVPGVSVSDELMMIGTSKHWAEEVYDLWGDGLDSPTVHGSLVELRFDLLWDAAEAWLVIAEQEQQRVREEQEKLEEEARANERALAADSSEDDGEPDGELESSDEGDDPLDVEQVRKVLNYLRTFESIRWQRRMEQGRERGTLEIKLAS